MRRIVGQSSEWLISGILDIRPTRALFGPAVDQPIDTCLEMFFFEPTAPTFFQIILNRKKETSLGINKKKYNLLLPHHLQTLLPSSSTLVEVYLFQFSLASIESI
jgi:hypothetical protein